MPIRCIKDVYAPPEADDGCRVIVMRRYPRGVAKWRAHGFLPELGPTLPLVHWYHEQKNAIEAQWRNTDPERFGTDPERSSLDRVLKDRDPRPRTRMLDSSRAQHYSTSWRKGAFKIPSILTRQAGRFAGPIQNS